MFERRPALLLVTAPDQRARRPALTTMVSPPVAFAHAKYVHPKPLTRWT
jgi:hypothetical protein